MDAHTVINQYEIVEHIGRGGMADVWSARDLRLNRMVAIKTIAHGLSQEADPVGMFKQEAQTIAQMEHPHILPIYDFGEYEDQLYIVMRYVAGGSLEDILRRGPLPLDEALRLGNAIAGALDYAHLNKVVHLDLKPPNVLLDSHQSPYLADFGLATVLDPEGKATNPGSGTLLYMAPEQLTSDVIDYRADLYSFAIVMFHILTGELPFEGSGPLALKQMQLQQHMPGLEEINPSIPPRFTSILRRATALEPSDRYESLTEIMDDLQAVYLEASGAAVGVGAVSSDALDTDEMGDEATSMREEYADLDSEILEAVDIYSRARHNWAGGNGRFLLGATNYLVMNSYYANASQYGLQLDQYGTQMMLRGALEYDQSVDYWWDQLDEADRRWVCLHALRSANPPARVRALQRLETLEDAEDRPQIPKLVAQMLQVETNEEARIAALRLLGTRARLMRPNSEYAIKTEYRGRLISTITREGVQERAPAEWQEIVYSPEIDLLIAETALDYGMPRVAEYAGRVVGRMRSITAARHLANAQREGRRGALRALAVVRDEAPSLPSVVSSPARAYAWLANTVRRMFDRPLSLIFRFAMAWLGGWIAMGMNIFLTFRSEELFAPQRWANTLAVGLVFGLVVAILVLVVDEFSSRLRGFWPWWVRLLTTSAFGFWFGSMIWAVYVYFYLQQERIWNVLHFGGLGLMSGFVLSAMLNLRSYVAVPLTALLTYIPINIGYFVGLRFMDVGPFTYGEGALPQLGSFLLAYDSQQEIYTIAIPFALLIAVGGHFPRLVEDVVQLVAWLRRPDVSEAEATQLQETAPPTAVFGQPGKAAQSQVDPGTMDTEHDVNAARTDAPPTEPYTTDSESETASRGESRRVNRSTGINVDDLKTDDDANQGQKDTDADDT